MFVNPHMSIIVTGGTSEENSHLVSAIHQSLYNNGFTNVEIGTNHDAQCMPMLAQLRAINPELFDTKMVISANNHLMPVPTLLTPIQHVTSDVTGNGINRLPHHW